MDGSVDAMAMSKQWPALICLISLGYVSTSGLRPHGARGHECGEAATWSLASAVDLLAFGADCLQGLSVVPRLGDVAVAEKSSRNISR